MSLQEPVTTGSQNEIMFHSLSQPGLQRNYIENDIRYLFDHCTSDTFVGSRSNAHGHFGLTFKMSEKTKGHQVKLFTFQQWGVSDVIGYKTLENCGQIMVNFIWWKVCAEHKDMLSAHPKIRGQVKASSKAFTEGTSVVTKHQVS